jgi:hypothetical protein
VTDDVTLDAIALENDQKATIARLAGLSPLQYDKQRTARQLLDVGARS